MADKPAQSRLRAALPGPALGFLGSLGWAAAMGASAALAGVMKAWSSGGNLDTVIVIFAIGGLVAFVPALTAYRFLGGQKVRGQRIALAFLTLAAATIVCTSATFTLIFRTYYAQWHDEILTGDWFREQFYTTASSTYQFAVLGLRSFLPLGLPALFAASWLISKKPV